jgi:hypothetical protein
MMIEINNDRENTRVRMDKKGVYFLKYENIF